MVEQVDIIDGDVSAFDDWYKTENQRREDLNIATLAQTGLQIIQLGVYYYLADRAIDNRDDKIDKQIAWMQELEDYKENQDLPMLNCKKDVLTDLNLPSVDMCYNANLYNSDAINDGKAVDEKSISLAQETCEGIPQGWGLHEGTLMAGKAHSYASGIASNHAKRRREDFRTHKTRLVIAGQQGMKAVYNANEVLAKYAQAAAIHSGLSDLFIQGFNSAGAGLGVLLGRLAQGSGTTNANPSTTSSNTPENVGVPLNSGNAGVTT